MDYTGRIITKNPQTPSANGAPGVWTLDEAMQYSKQGKWPPGYQISRSVRLRSSASGYFSRTFSVASTDRTKGTLSVWIKRGKLSAQVDIISCYDGSSAASSDIYFNSSNQLQFDFGGGGATSMVTTPVFRDPSAWYHLVVSVDTTQATSTNRVFIYINGVSQTFTGTYPNQNANWQIAAQNANNRIGTNWNNSGAFFDGYLTEINFIDGQALTPASFGYFDTYTGVWQPAPYTGTYGTNGFYLTFADNSAATAAAIGKDYSGNGNNWTPSAGISLTTGTTYDSMVDVPINWGTDTGVGGEVRGNYATFNPIVAATGITISDGNLKGTNTTSFNTCTGTIAIAENTNKYYWEIVSTSSAATPCLGFHGVQKASKAGTVPTTAGNGAYCYYGSSGQYWADGTNSAYGSTYAVNDVIGVALDASSSPATITFYKNNVSQGIKTLPALTNDYWLPIGNDQGGSSPTYVINFGQRPFAYTAPSGYKALCTQNISVPTVLNGASYMAATLYTGNGGTLSVSNGANNTIGTTFQPDLVWVKSRSAATDHKLTDSVRGTTKALISNTTGAETTDTNGLTAFGSSGFTVGTDTVYNNSGATYVGWQWKGGGTAVTNTAGTITSSVSANTTAGFSVVAYTGNGVTSATVGHGLGATPSLIITKNRDIGTSAYSWYTNHVSLGAGQVELESTLASNNPATVYSNGGLAPATSWTSNVFSFVAGTAGNANNVNNNTSKFIAYCWAPITGYSAFGSYTGNGSADGPFVYLGFRPRFIMFKVTSTTNIWIIHDTSRDTYNVSGSSLLPNAADAEYSSNQNMDIVSNGFKLRSTDSATNASGATFIYAAFAENPFTIARAR